MSTGNNSNKLIKDSNHVHCICQNLTIESKTNFVGRRKGNTMVWLSWVSLNLLIEKNGQVGVTTARRGETSELD